MARRKLNDEREGALETGLPSQAEETGVPGMRTLRTAVGRQLCERGDELATKLVERALQGDYQSTKIVMELAGPTAQGKGTAKPKPGKSLARKLAKETDWQDEPIEREKQPARTRAEARDPLDQEFRRLQ